jgi:hypothetical protein
MPITEQQILDLSNWLLPYQRNVSLAKKQLDELIQKDTFIISNGSGIRDIDAGVKISFDFLTYLIYDSSGDLESANTNAYEQYFEDNHNGVNPTSIEPNYYAFNDLFVGMCQSIDSAIGYLKMRESQLQEWVSSQP